MATALAIAAGCGYRAAMRVALLATADFWPALHPRDPSGATHRQVRRMIAAAAAAGCTLEPVDWARPQDWSAYAAVTPLLAWNYPRAADAFAACLAAVEAAGAALINPIATVRANMDKGYLADLAARGAATIPTLFVAQADDAALAAAFDALDAEEIVVKPRVGAGAWRQARMRRGARPPPAEDRPEGAALIQPFLPAVAEEGEASLVFFGGAFSHALMKTPRPGDYRTQGHHGATERAWTPPADAVATAARALALLPEACAYARVDLVRDRAGAWAVMELELIEPFLYFDQAGEPEAAAARFGRALAAAAARTPL